MKLPSGVRGKDSILRYVKDLITLNVGAQFLAANEAKESRLLALTVPAPGPRPSAVATGGVFEGTLPAGSLSVQESIAITHAQLPGLPMVPPKSLPELAVPNFALAESGSGVEPMDSEPC